MVIIIIIITVVVMTTTIIKTTTMATVMMMMMIRAKFGRHPGFDLPSAKLCFKESKICRRQSFVSGFARIKDRMIIKSKIRCVDSNDNNDVDWHIMTKKTIYSSLSNISSSSMK
jgi:hypothetical protein